MILSITPSADAAAISKLTISAASITTPATNYIISITGSSTNGILSHTIPISLSVLAPTDASGQTTDDSGSINHPPISKVGNVSDVREGDIVTLDGSASKDLDSNDMLTYSWIQTDDSGIPIHLSDASSPTPMFTVPTLSADTQFTFKLTVNDGKGGISKPTYITLKANSVPTYSSNYPALTAESQNGIAVQSGSHLYMNGENIKVAGLVSSDVISAASGVDKVTIQVMDGKGKKVGEQDVAFNKQDGKYDTTIHLPNNLGIGEYKIVSKLKFGITDVMKNVGDVTKLKKLESDSTFKVGTPASFTVAMDNKNFKVDIVSNSKVSNFEFKPEQKKVSFVVDGDSGTTGATQITIPKSMLGGKLQVVLDGQTIPAYSGDVIIKTSTDSAETLEINYHHSSHTIEIIGTQVVPEFSSISALLMAILIGSVLATFGVRTRSKWFKEYFV